LYCGKELALLKRLTGGGEFCSESHRNKYKDEYNDLALSRLLQLQPEESRSEAPYTIRPVRATAPDGRIESTQGAAPGVEGLAGLSSYLLQQQPAAPSAFVTAGLAEPAAGESDPVLPTRDIEVILTDSDVTLAERVAWNPPIRPERASGAVRERGVQVREFVRSAINVEVRMSVSGITVPEAAGEPLEVYNDPIVPHRPPLWTAGPAVFDSASVELGALARLNYKTLGFDDLGSSAAPAPPYFAPPAAAGVRPIASAPVKVEQPRESAWVPAPPAAPPRVEIVQPPASAVPSRATQALPVTLHGLAAGRPKPSMVFSTPFTALPEPQIPASNALPLRPVMTLGPAIEAPEAAAPIDIKSESISNAAKMPQRGGNGKSRRTDVRIVPPVKTASAPSPAAESPAPVARPLIPAQAPDLGLDMPMLHLHAPEGWWARMPMMAKLALAAAILGGASGLAYMAMSSGSASAGQTRTVAQSGGYEVGLPLQNTGWIEDWAAAKNGRGPRIDILSGSVPLSDYRMEFQAQIETKAIGWVFRALNPRNYYVAKVEAIKPGLEPTVALVRYAVIDGQAEQRVEVPLTMSVRAGTVYKIRFEALGSRFSTWIQDQKVADWNDKRIGSGGVGIFSAPGESAAVHGIVNVVPLVPKN
jgi:hypothetical protein